ncbi:PapD-like superfamily [Sesbania bispinosa]|nr:PapD-like superfamily [Sesbania bispinosa]
MAYLLGVLDLLFRDILQQQKNKWVGMARNESESGGKLFKFPKLPFRHFAVAIASISSLRSVVTSYLPTPRRLKLDPSNKLYFPYEPGRQVKSAIKIKNTSKSNVAFKFQTTVPKSCFMRPPGAILAPGKSTIATVFKFIEHTKNNQRPEKTRLKFKIMSLQVKSSIDYVPELFDEQKDQVAVEKILQVVFLDPEHPSPALEKLKQQLDEADAAALEARNKKPSKQECPKVIGEGLVIDEWKERRERYLAKQHGELAMESVQGVGLEQEITSSKDVV